MKILAVSDEESPALWDHYVPGRLDAQINQWVSYYASQLVGYVCGELIRRGVLNNPDGSSPLTDGVFYVEGEYIQDI